jgi:hypothetical protein
MVVQMVVLMVEMMVYRMAELLVASTGASMAVLMVAATACWMVDWKAEKMGSSMAEQTVVLKAEKMVAVTAYKRV